MSPVGLVPRQGALGLAHRLDAANRSFILLLGLALVPYLVLGVLGCGVVSVAIYRLATGGLAGLNQDGQDLRLVTALMALVVVGTVLAGLSLIRQLQATRQLHSRVHRAQGPVPDRMRKAASSIGMAQVVRVVSESRPLAFTYGLWTPRVVVSEGLLRDLSDDELEAVLQHERYHVRNWDTLKVVVARSASAAFFFLPVLRSLCDRYLASRELVADQRAVSAMGQRPVAGALYAAMQHGAPTGEPMLAAAAALASDDYLELRVTQLETGEEPALAPPSRWAVVLTVTTLVGAVGIATYSALSVTGQASPWKDDSVGSPAFQIPLMAMGMVLCAAFWVGIGALVWRLHSLARSCVPAQPGPEG